MISLFQCKHTAPQSYAMIAQKLSQLRLITHVYSFESQGVGVVIAISLFTWKEVALEWNGYCPYIHVCVKWFERDMGGLTYNNIEVVPVVPQMRDRTHNTLKTLYKRIYYTPYSSPTKIKALLSLE